MCECGGHSGPAVQSLDELEFERGLWFAAQYGDLDRALHLLDKGSHVDQRDAAGYTPLHYAARNGHLSLCKLLLDRGACVDATTCHGRATPLQRAAAVGKLEIVQFLIERRADVHSKDSDGRNALHRAVLGGHLQVCRVLDEKAPDLRHVEDARGNTPLEYASGNQAIAGVFA